MRCLKLLRLLERQRVPVETQSASVCSLEGLGVKIGHEMNPNSTNFAGTYLLANVAPNTSPAALRRPHGDGLPCGCGLLNWLLEIVIFYYCCYLC